MKTLNTMLFMMVMVVLVDRLVLNIYITNIQAAVLARDFFDEHIRKNSKKLKKMKDREQVKKFLVNLFNNCQKRYRKN